MCLGLRDRTSLPHFKGLNKVCVKSTQQRAFVDFREVSNFATSAVIPFIIKELLLLYHERTPRNPACGVPGGSGWGGK